MPVQSIDAAITLSSSVLNRAKHYLGPDEQAPKGVKVQQGARGGKFYEMGGGGATGTDDDEGMGFDEGRPSAPFELKERVKYPDVNGKMRPALVDHIRPDGMIEVRDQRGGIHKLNPGDLERMEKPEDYAKKPLQINRPIDEWRQFDDPRDEMQHWRDMEANLNAEVQRLVDANAPMDRVRRTAAKRDQAQDRAKHMQKVIKLGEKFGRSNAKADAERAAGGGVAGIGPKANVAIADAEKLLGDLKAGKLANPQEYVDAARRAVQVYEQERSEQGSDADPKRAPLAQAAETAEKIRDRAKELAEKWRDRYTYAKQKGVPGEELDAVKGRMEEAGKEFLQANAAHYKAAQALAGYDQPKRQPKPRQPKQARPVVQHKPGDLDREAQRHAAEQERRQRNPQNDDERADYAKRRQAFMESRQGEASSSPRQMLQQHRQKKAQPHRKIDMRQENRAALSIG